jgi:hypothetical protein
MPIERRALGGITVRASALHSGAAPKKKRREKSCLPKVFIAQQLLAAQLVWIAARLTLFEQFWPVTAAVEP